MKFRFLGTGASAGVPVIGCKCPVCKAGTTKRLRPSALVELYGKRFLIDVGPDFRAQALRFGIDAIDGLLLTHVHFDHIAGLDELRAFGKEIPCLLSEESLTDLQRRYYYLFEPGRATAKFSFQVLKGDEGDVDFAGINLGYCSFWQTDMKVNGFRFGNFAYISDIKTYDEALFSFLKGVKTLVISALKDEASPFHLSFQEAIAFAHNVGAEETWLTHLGHFLEHDEINERLPKGVKAAYDGLELCMN